MRHEIVPGILGRVRSSDDNARLRPKKPRGVSPAGLSNSRTCETLEAQPCPGRQALHLVIGASLRQSIVRAELRQRGGERQVLAVVVAIPDVILGPQLVAVRGGVLVRLERPELGAHLVLVAEHAGPAYAGRLDAEVGDGG